ncbi:adenylate cyclase [Thermodesulfovibrio aggregans]|uniref:Adenylate cyclase n=1 Tax=Thermodesulfovibrio aggregans TaxID=86166 RepID=A0A0U9HWB1_9BACT|nr:adenylate/guanylate cyclase domain-containing protein [Thermodesulfovibrio aggregans]GAQ95233.1 adenylate cyclase [Thermodesulfovibrio aggregans]
MNKKNLSKKVAILSILSILFSSFVYLTEILKPFEFKVYDLFTKYLNPAKKSDNICLIYIDQLSIDELSKEKITWPWPRQIYAPVIEYLSEADAVFIDILLTEQSSYGVEDDKILAEAVEKSGNVYLPVVLSREKRDFDEKYAQKISYQTQIPLKYEYNSIIFPIEELKLSAKNLGNVSILPDEDGIYRHMPLFFKVKEYVIPAFVVSYFIDKNQILVKNNEILINNSPIPLNNGSLLLKYSSDKNPFTVFSFVEILGASTSGDKKLKDFFKGKTVFIGLTAAGLFDLKSTPVSSKTPGVFIHATAFENLINKNFIKIIPDFFIFVLLFLISLTIPYTFLKQHSMKINLLVFLCLLIFLISASVILFRFSLYLQLLPPFLSLIFSSIITLLYSYATEGKERKFIKRTFSQYMDKKIVDYLLEHPESITPGGQKKTATVFFADIAGFTSISEKLSPEDTAMMLHRVLNSLTSVVIKYGGVVDKYIGDCIMAFWGVPLKTDSDEINACRAALECIHSIEELNKEFLKEGMPPVKIRIGIHTGDVIAGNIGSDRLFNYTVIGDTVNIASRLESVNKFFKTNIIISEETYSKTSDIFLARELGVITVKGRVKPLKIFEILGEKDRLKDEKILLVENYNAGYLLFRQQKWNEAKEIFLSILKKFPEDFPSRFYLTQIDELQNSQQLTEDWFIIKIKEK